MADFARIKRNIGRMVDQGAPEADIDEYIRTEGVTLSQVRAFKGVDGPPKDVKAEADFRETTFGGYGMPQRVLDNATFGAAIPVTAGLEAAGKTAYKALTGQETDIWGDYTYSRDVQDELLRRSREGQGIPGTAAEIALSLPFAGPQMLLRKGSSYLQQLYEAGKQGAKYSSIYGFNSGRGDVGDVATNTLTHGAAGAFAAPLLKMGIDGSVIAGTGARNLLRMIGNKITSRAPEDAAEVSNRIADFAAANVRPYGPAVSNSDTQRKTAEGLAGSIFGAPLRREAQGAVDDATAAVQRTVRGAIGNQPVSDAGAEVQGTLRRNLVERSTPSGRIASMTDDELARITGPIDDRGFAPPPPVVDPIPPRPVTPARAQAIDPDRVPYDIVQPNMPAREAVNWTKPDYSAAKARPETVRQFEDVDRQLVGAWAAREAAEAQFGALAKAMNLDAEQLWRRVAQAPQMYTQDVVQAYRALKVANDAINSLGPAHNKAVQAMKAERDADFARIAKEAHARASMEADARHIEASNKARRDAEAATRENRERAIRQAQLEAEERATAETARLRAEADAEARSATQRAQQRAQAEYEATRKARPGFEPGRSRESYPTEFDAAYTQLNRQTPTFQRNPLGSRAAGTRTATEGLMDQLALEMRASGKLPGYREGRLYGDNNMPSEQFLQNARSMFGDDVATRLQALMERRANSQFPPGPDGLRALGTAIRRAKQEARKPQFPAQPMPERAAALARLEGALKEDYYQFMRETGPQGQRLVDLTRNVDSEYGQYIEGLRKPLAKMFGDNVNPIDAVDRIAKAAQDGDLRMLRAYMRVMSEKGDPNRGAGVIVAHLTNNAQTLSDFMKGMSKIPQDSRRVMFAGDRGRPLLQAIERLERVARRLEPYEKAIRSGGGIDFTNRANIWVGLSALTHVYPALVLGGGAVTAARFMSSPRYVDWMLRVSRARTPRQLNVEWGRLSQIVARDAEVSSALSELIGIGPAKAASLPLARKGGTMARPVLFAGEKSEAADTGALSRAKTMLAGGATPDEIWQKTGWHHGNDGLWRYEIDDSKARFKRDFKGRGDSGTLDDLIDHREFFRAYPGASKIPFRTGKLESGDDAVFEPDGSITIAEGTPSGRARELLETLLHETQHWIEDIEGFHYGDKSPYDRRRGENEAFSVEKRSQMTAQQRRMANPQIAIERESDRPRFPRFRP